MSIPTARTCKLWRWMRMEPLRAYLVLRHILMARYFVVSCLCLQPLNHEYQTLSEPVTKPTKRGSCTLLATEILKKIDRTQQMQGSGKRHSRLDALDAVAMRFAILIMVGVVLRLGTAAQPQAQLAHAGV